MIHNCATFSLSLGKQYDVIDFGKPIRMRLYDGSGHISRYLGSKPWGTRHLVTPAKSNLQSPLKALLERNGFETLSPSQVMGNHFAIKGTHSRYIRKLVVFITIDK